MSGTSPPTHIRILSLDGGGIKGYTSLLILKRIFRTLRDEGNLPEEPKPCDVFDIMVGTSTGGLIAVMLGRLRMTIDECIREYETVAQRVFDKKPAGGQIGKLVKGLLSSPFYDIGNLQTVIQGVLEKRGISTDEALREASIPACKGDVLRNYESLHPTQENYDCTIWEAASATAAAPLYFKSVKFKKQGENWCDGGLRRNNPVREAVTEFYRERTFQGKEIGCLLSIGTGVPKIASVSSSLPGFLKGCIDMLTDSETIAEDFAREELAKLLTSQGRYYRFSVPQGMQALEMDEVKEANIEKLRGLTTDYLNKVGSGTEVHKCAAILLRPVQNVRTEREGSQSLLPYQTCLHYVSRDLYTEKLRSFFQPTTSERQSFVLYGLGGVGKTQIALEFAHSHAADMHVFWIRADSYPSFVHDYGRILQLLDPSSQAEANIFGPNQVELLLRTRALLQSILSSWIIILDNADNYDEFVVGSGGGLSIGRFLPQSGRFLISTRDPRFLGGFVPADNGIRVEIMNDEDAITLMRKSVPKHLGREFSEETALELLQELGNLPLGIAQAAANIGELQLSMDEYVDAYKDRRDRMQLLARPVEDNQGIDEAIRPQSVLVTWELAFANLEQKHPDSATCLKYMGLLHNQNIPEALLRVLPDFRHLRTVEFKLVLRRLLQSSLIEPVLNLDSEDNEYHIHPLLHERIFERMRQGDMVHYIGEIVSVVAVVFPVIAFDENDASTPKNKAFAAYLLPHALRVLSLISELGVSSKLCARLLQIVGYFLSTAKMTSLAVTLSTSAINMAQGVFGADDPSVHYIRKYRIKCLIADQQLEEAEAECRIALRTLSTEKFQTDHPGTKYELEMGTILRALSDTLIAAGKEDIFGVIMDIEFDVALFRPVFYLFHFAWILGKSLQRRGELERARTFLDNIFLKAQKLNLDANEEKHYLSAMLLNVQIMHSLFQQSEKSMPDHDAKLQELLEISEAVFTRDLSLFGPTSPETWKALQSALQLQMSGGTLERGVLLVTKLLKSAASTRITFDHAFLNTAGILFEQIGLLTAELQLSHIHQRQEWAAELEAASAEMIQYQELRYDDFLVTPSLLNSRGVYHQQRGQFMKAQSLHLRALELERDTEDSEKLQPPGILVYNIMLAIARQSDGEDEAVKFREECMAELREAEIIYGDLPSRLQRDISDKAVYTESQRRLVRGELGVNDDWWLEHEDVLRRTELRYGLLDIHVS